VVFDEEVMWRWSEDQATDLNFELNFEVQSEFFQTINIELVVVEPGASADTYGEIQMTGGVPPEDNEEHQSSPVMGHVTPPLGRVGTPLSTVVSQQQSPPSKNLDTYHDDDAPPPEIHASDRYPWS
jgi:hypothetical protein